MADSETPEAKPPPPDAEETVEALAALNRLPEADRRAIARQLAPPEPGTDGKPLTPEQARQLLTENPAKFHALLDAQLAGGPRLIRGF